MDEQTSKEGFARSRRRIGLRDLLAAAVGVLSFSTIENLGHAFDVWDQAQLAFGWKPDAVEIAKSDERERFTRDLLQMAHRRVLEIRTFTDLAAAQRPQSEMDEAWKAYHAARIAWSERALINALAVNRWYGSQKRKMLEDVIEPLMAQGHWCMLDLRFNGTRALAQSAPSCSQGIDGTGTSNLAYLRILANLMQRHLYCFGAGINAELPRSIIIRSDDGGRAPNCATS